MPDRPSTASTTPADAMTEADCGIQDANSLLDVNKWLTMQPLEPSWMNTAAPTVSHRCCKLMN